MSERFTPAPQEARDFKVDEEKPPELSKGMERQIQEGLDEKQRPYEAVGTETSHFLDPEGQPVTYEKKPRQVSPEYHPAKEPGDHGKPIHSDDPNQTAASNDQTTATDIDENAQNPDTSANSEIAEKTKLRIRGLDKDIGQAEEVKADMIAESHEAMKANDMERAERSLSTAGKADEAVTNMRLEQSELQAEVDKLENQ